MSSATPYSLSMKISGTILLDFQPTLALGDGEHFVKRHFTNYIPSNMEQDEYNIPIDTSSAGSIQTQAQSIPSIAQAERILLDIPTNMTLISQFIQVSSNLPQYVIFPSSHSFGLLLPMLSVDEELWHTDMIIRLITCLNHTIVQ